MSTKTEHLGLHQWEPEDSFLRTDFNEDFAKIDAAVGLLQNSLVYGTFKIASGQQALDIDLGFRPRLVVLLCQPKRLFGVLTDDDFVFAANDGSTSYVSGGGIVATDTGFRISSVSYGMTLNPDAPVHYLAFR